MNLMSKSTDCMFDQKEPAGNYVIIFPQKETLELMVCVSYGI